VSLGVFAAASISLCIRVLCNCAKSKKNITTMNIGLPIMASKSMTLPVYANYAEWVLMPNSYPELAFWSIIGMHIYQQKRRAVQVFDHPHDPNPNAEWTAKG
jgi:hypothetical protein